MVTRARERGQPGALSVAGGADHADRVRHPAPARCSVEPCVQSGAAGSRRRLDSAPRGRRRHPAHHRVPFPALADGEADAHIRDMSENIGRVLGRRCISKPSLRRWQCTSRARRRRACARARAAGRACCSWAGISPIGNCSRSRSPISASTAPGAAAPAQPFRPRARLARLRYAHGLDEQIASGESVFERVCETLERSASSRCLPTSGRQGSSRRSSASRRPPTSFLRAARGATGAPIVLMSMRRLGPARFSSIPSADRRVGGQSGTGDHAAHQRAHFEAELIAAPGQWLWGHPRWADALDGRPSEPSSLRRPAIER